MLHCAVGQHAEGKNRRGAIEISRRSDVFGLFLMFRHGDAWPFEQAIECDRRQRRKAGTEYAGPEAAHRSRGLRRLQRYGPGRVLLAPAIPARPASAQSFPHR